MSFIEPSKGEMPDIEDGLHNVVCRNVQAVKVEKDQFGNFEKIQLTIEFEDFVGEDGEPVKLDPRCNAKWNEKATLYKWSVAFDCGASPDSRFNWESFKDKHARALIEVPRNEEGEQTGWPRVKDFMPVVKRNGASAPSQRTPAPSVEVVEEMPIGEWWAATRQVGLKREDVMNRSGEMYGVEPSELTGEERLSLFQSFV